MPAHAHKNNSVFENLSKNISESERMDLLDKVKGNSGDEGDEVKDDLLAEKLTRYEDDDIFEFERTFREQPILTRFVMFIMSLLTNSSVKEVMNRRILAGCAKKIEIQYPGLIIYSRKLVGNLFYEKLRQLNGAVKFFVPYMANYEDDAGDYYFLIGHQAVSDLEKQLYDETDPYKFPLSKPIPDDEKIRLRDGLKQKISSMSNDDRKKMNDVVLMFEWLHQLSKVSIDRILSMFTMEENGLNECLFSFLRVDMENLMEIMFNKVPMDDRIIDFFCMLAGKRDVDIAAFRNEASANLSIIEGFSQNLPLTDILRIIRNNAFHSISSRTFSVKWQEPFLKKWLSVFNDRFSAWTKDYCREQIKKKLFEYFELTDFPLFPNRPWQELGEEFEFPYELTLGLINFFMFKFFRSYNRTFQAVSVKGEFVSKENQHELYEAIDSFMKINEKINSLVKSFSSEGDFYEEFRIYMSLKNKTANSVKRVHVILENLKVETVDMQEQFCVMCQQLINVLDGCLSDRRTGKYCALLNLNRLRDDGVEYKEIIADRIKGMTHVYEVIKDLGILEG